MVKRQPKGYRVKWVYDPDASFEESNGEPRPMTAEEYASNEYRACPNGHRVGPGRIENGRAWCAQCDAEYADVSYEDYRAYYGNPDRHVYLGCIVQTQCPCCNHWSEAQSLWHIDFMDDDREYIALDIDKAIPAMDALSLPGYAAEVARDLLAEAGMPIAKKQLAAAYKANMRAHAKAQADAR